MRIVVAGAFAAPPGHGGATWAVLQYALGFEALGHEVLLVDPAPPTAPVSRYLDRVAVGHGLAGRAVSLAGAEERVRAADLLVNLGGVLTDLDLVDRVPMRVYVDLDPAFTQLWHAIEGIDMNLDGHHRFVTYGQSLGTGGCEVPTCGVDWISTVPPVVLDRWPVAPAAPRYGLTTVGNWRSYGSITVAGTHFGQKAHSVRQLLDVPGRVPAVCVEPALRIHPDEVGDLAALEAAGWRLQEPDAVTGDPDRYRSFVQASTAELGVAKAGYVVSRCGWFSDRSVCYLASGRPVIAEDTGWPAHLPSGSGLLAFGDTDGAAAAVTEVLGDYERHRRAARAVAEEHFDARRVLTRLLEEIAA